jgi:hypothetical protein
VLTIGQRLEQRLGVAEHTGGADLEWLAGGLFIEAVLTRSPPIPQSALPRTCPLRTQFSDAAPFIGGKLFSNIPGEVMRPHFGADSHPVRKACGWAPTALSASTIGSRRVALLAWCGS